VKFLWLATWLRAGLAAQLKLWGHRLGSISDDSSSGQAVTGSARDTGNCRGARKPVGALKGVELKDFKVDPNTSGFGKGLTQTLRHQDFWYSRDRV